MCIVHVLGLYVLYAYLYEILLSMNITIYISEFHYKSVYSLILRGPLFILLGIIFYKNNSRFNKIAGLFYFLIGTFWFCTLILALSKK